MAKPAEIYHCGRQQYVDVKRASGHAYRVLGWGFAEIPAKERGKQK
jgi:hypothetical protein